jgi:hypothetical protein
MSENEQNLQPDESGFDYGATQEEKSKSLIRSEAMLSAKLLEVDSFGVPDDKGYATITPSDIAKFNLNPQELITAKRIAMASNLCKEVGIALKIDLRQAQRYLVNELAFDGSVTRAKGGFSAYLSKSSYTKNENLLSEQQLEENYQTQDKGLFGFLKKK